MNQVSSLTVGGWFSRGWSAYRTNATPLIGGAVILAVINVVVSLIGKGPAGVLIMLAFNLVVIPVLSVGWCLLCLKSVRGENAQWSDVFAAFSRFGPAWATFMLLFLIVLGGVFLLVVPGIILGLKYGQSMFAVMDRGLSARQAIGYSGKMTQGWKGKLFGMFVVGFLLSLLAYPFSFGLQRLGEGSGATLLAVGIVPFLATVFVITPWLGASYAAAYDSLAQLEEGGAPR